jgi:hypothetical protein
VCYVVLDGELDGAPDVLESDGVLDPTPSTPANSTIQFLILYKIIYRLCICIYMASCRHRVDIV